MSTVEDVRFVVQNFGADASLITNLIGLDPSVIASAGWSSTVGGHLDSQVAWILAPEGRRRRPASVKLVELIKTLEIHSQGVSRVAEKFEAYVEVSFERKQLNRSRPLLIEIPPDTIHALGRLGVALRFQGI